MARRQSDNSLGYATGKWAASDGAYCDLMDRAQTIGERADVVDAVLRCMRRCHVELWDASSFKSRSWKVKASAAFQVSESDLASSTGLSRQRVRTFFRVAEDHGLIVKLSDRRPRKDERGSVPAVYTFACYVSGDATTATLPKPSKPAAVGKDKAAATASKWGLA